MTAGRDRMTVMGMMTLANEGTSLSTTSGLLGGSPRFQHLSISALLSHHQGKARHILLSLDITMGKLVSVQRFQLPNLSRHSKHQPYLASRFAIQRRHQGIANSLSTTRPSKALQGEVIRRAGYAILTCFLISCMLPGRYVINAWMCSCTLGTR